MRYFKREEFACKCGCGYDTVDYELMKVLIEVRTYFGEPVIINSACRCVDHNKAVGGKPNSQHLFARAADIRVLGIEPNLVYNYINNTYPDQYGLGNYSKFTHIDTRNYKARW